MKKYFIHYNHQQEGPYDFEDLKNKKLSANTPVWYEGLTNWTTIEKVEELKQITSTTPPPFTTSAAIPPPILKEAAITQPPKKYSFLKRLQVVAILLILVVGATYLYKYFEEQEYQNQYNQKEDAKTAIRNNISAYVTAERSAYNYSALGGISNLSITVNNNTNYLINTVNVKIIYFKANGDVWDTRIIDFNLLNPYTKSTIRVPDTNRGTSVQYEIVSIKSSELGLN